MNKDELFYIYNHRQADFFMKNGLVAIGSGYGREGDPYILFKRTEQAELIFLAWKALSKARSFINK